ncbi:peptidase M20 domain-containing protein 2 [Trichonephila inaurata madagascariensis]|uniref:Peptidase M20 domain-containing protein 2 n=1 Tax=Trichonephila inaurata madagascariensis TaxID=2747483 RepID=A0A8X6WUN7_9ARAC|nr:peptidase M20 domain-containing protein 2 [Trichonephila inaurata madagascariensis]
MCIKARRTLPDAWVNYLKYFSLFNKIHYPLKSVVIASRYWISICCSSKDIFYSPSTTHWKPMEAFPDPDRMRFLWVTDFPEIQQPTTQLPNKYVFYENGPVIAVLLEYDALPDIGHACGHNLISEAGLATSLAIKAVMEADPKLEGKLLVLGTPAEECKGGKIDLLNAGAFREVDAAMMVHPSNFTSTFPPVLSRLTMTVDFKGKEAHAAAFPWEGRNALDAAVSTYQNISLLRQHIKPSNRIHAIITKGGVVPNVIPAESTLQIAVRSATKTELKDLTARIMECVKSGAAATGCTASIDCDERHCYESLVTNKFIGKVYDQYSSKLGGYFVPLSKDISSFPSFWARFKSAVHENSSLNDVDKFSYLKSVVTSDAELAIRGLTLTSENYAKAIKILEDRFGRKELIVDFHMNRLLNLTPVRKSFDVIALRNLYDQLEIHIRGLESLEISPDSYSCLLFPIIMKAIPLDLALEYNKNTMKNNLKSLI